MKLLDMQSMKKKDCQSRYPYKGGAFGDNCWAMLNTEWLLYPTAQGPACLRGQQIEKMEICVGIAPLNHTIKLYAKKVRVFSIIYIHAIYTWLQHLPTLP